MEDCDMPKSCAILLGALLAAALLPGCRVFESCRPKPKEEPASKTKLLKEGPSSIIQKGDESLPGGVTVTTEGKNVWPPRGPGCDKLVACCDAAARLSGTVGLSCQLSVAVQPVDCKKAQDNVVGTMKDLGVAPPAECKP